VPPTPTFTPTADTSVVYPPPEGDLAESDDLVAPVITQPEEDLETIDVVVRFEGTAEPHARIIVYDGDVAIGMVWADAQGQWYLIPVEPLAEGEHIFVVRVTDGEQVSSASEPVRVTVYGERLPVTGQGSSTVGLAAGILTCLMILVVLLSKDKTHSI
jgi:hypothetical protein